MNASAQFICAFKGENGDFLTFINVQKLNKSEKNAIFSMPLAFLTISSVIISKFTKVLARLNVENANFLVFYHGNISKLGYSRYTWQ